MQEPFFQLSGKDLCNQSHGLLLDLVKNPYQSAKGNANSKFPTDDPPVYEIPRQLVYQRGSNPSVSWDWWIDPNSGAYLVREEFMYMDILGPDYRWWCYQWEELWPLRYPEWSDYLRCHVSDTDYPELNSVYKRAHERAQKRANRRWEKKSMKAARAQGLKRRDRMPGAWPV